MRWDRFFEDLEDQLDSEWEAERAALDTEAERLRVARLTFRDRLASIADSEARITCELADGIGVTGAVAAAGPDWLALDDGGDRGVLLVPAGAIVAVGLRHEDLLLSARGSSLGRLRERMTLGFVLRDLARRRVPVTLTVRGGRELAGTVDRAAADHLDLALHDRGAPRRRDLVAGHRLVPFAVISSIRLETPVDLV